MNLYLSCQGVRKKEDFRSRLLADDTQAADDGGVDGGHTIAETDMDGPVYVTELHAAVSIWLAIGLAVSTEQPKVCQLQVEARSRSVCTRISGHRAREP